MSANKKGLGRGFESLVPVDFLDESFDPTLEQDNHASELRHIKLDDISADPNQPRRHFDEAALEDLARSIKEHGILQPIVVTPYHGKFQIVAGERRYRAATQVGLTKIPALVRTLSEQHKLELSLIENIQRRDLNPLETAASYLKLRDQFNLTLEQIGQRVGGRSVSAISNTLRLLRLPQAVREAIINGQLSEGQARPLINLETVVIEAILPQIIKEEWSARKIEQYIVHHKRTEHAVSKQTPPAPVYENDTKQIAKRLGTNVTIKANGKGAGQIVIRFTNDEDFKRIQKLLAD